MCTIAQLQPSLVWSAPEADRSFQMCCCLMGAGDHMQGISHHVLQINQLSTRPSKEPTQWAPT